MLNPNASEFLPYAVSEEEGRIIDDCMRVFTHLASVNDTETLLSAASWSATASEFDEDEDLDDETAAWLDAEDVLIDRLYQAPRSARGDTQLRAKKLQARLQPLKREARPMRGSR